MEEEVGMWSGALENLHYDLSSLSVALVQKSGFINLIFRLLPHQQEAGNAEKWEFSAGNSCESQASHWEDTPVYNKAKVGLSSGESPK